MFVQYLWHELVRNGREQVFDMKTIITAAVPVPASLAYTAHIIFFKSLSCGSTSLVSLKKDRRFRSPIRQSLSYIPSVHAWFV